MSTLRRSSRLLKTLVPLGLSLSLGSFGLIGCSATSGPRTGVASKMKTFLSVGDKPLPVVTGEPGSTIAADTATGTPSVRRQARADGRISGRVYDAENHPVPDARVRLAVSGAAGGKIVSATTDRSGAFTLHGLRPGTEYTVIAETEGDDGPVTGRADARTSDTDVRISLGSQDEAPARASAPSRVNRVSDREPSSDDLEPGAVTPSAVNEEDLPPAREAEAMAPAESRSERSRASVSNRRAASRTSHPDAWRRGSSNPAASPNPTPPDPEAAPVDPDARGTGAPAMAPASPLDDGENPLPPALEPTPDSSTAIDPPGPDVTRLTSKAPDPDPAPFSEPLDTTRRLAASSPFESPTSPTGSITSTPPDDAAPGALVVVPETFGPVVVQGSDPFEGSHPTAPEPAPVTPKKYRAKVELKGSSWPSRAASSATMTTRTTRSRRLPDSASDTPRPTWGEVVAANGTTVTAEAPARAPSVTSRSGDARRAIALRTDTPGRPERTSRTIKTSYGKPECEYDDRLRRIIDFRLPDLDGKPVRFQELDADLVLIDFWGTWCQPCLKSLPHLVELQERMGTRLKVVGIACEADTPEASASKVAETARRLKVNYPVLLSRNDGTCPLQEALHIQAFPTMILVDRQGRVLWRDQGATPATLARLDRIIDSSPSGNAPRRY